MGENQKKPDRIPRSATPVDPEVYRYLPVALCVSIRVTGELPSGHSFLHFFQLFLHFCFCSC